eukprot:gnl/MRDRNA2_/MRDRNA2_69144_c0_seq1.p1 gnl/MRDRNA2_/MRDRNA2_69144_c0~~gnl/MRDRNA2_/MRDRNA2_69144_c0_seq1.p1  ORF type:complete len:303 (+),score=58.55 gnl/MRDRNA2_/MRDRNA2_69144_c0_seq1:143-1051(+)
MTRPSSRLHTFTLAAKRPGLLRRAMVAVEEADVWYFAIGSMTNPQSLAARELSPKRSMPARLLHHRLVWSGFEGMASAEKAPEETFHGVLHLMSNGDMKKLDAIEMGYDRVLCQAELYDGKVQECTVYSVNSTRFPRLAKRSTPPQQRYIDIIVEGCRYHGVDQGYIDWLLSQPCRERTKPKDYLSFEVPPDVRRMTLEDVRRGDGVEDHPLYRIANGKVLEYRGNRTGPAYERNMKKAGSTTDLLFDSAKMMYDPLFGLPASQEQMTAQHSQYREDMLKRMLMGFNASNVWVVVGLLDSKT